MGAESLLSATGLLDEARGESASSPRAASLPCPFWCRFCVDGVFPGVQAVSDHACAEPLTMEL